MKLAVLTPAKELTAGVVAPGAPVMGSATAAAGQATVTCTAPGSNGGVPIVAYTATGVLTGRSASSATTTIVIPMPLDGYVEMFRVVATNAEGLTSSPSALSNVVSQGYVPPPAPGTLGGNFTPQFASNGAAIFA